MASWLSTALQLIWEIVSRKLFLLPTAAAGLVAFLGLEYESVQLMIGTTQIPISYVAAGAIFIFWVLGGLLAKAVSLHRRLALDPEPDMSARDAFRHVMIYSKWALGRHPDDERYYENIEGELGNAARIGRLKVWGTPRANLPGSFSRRRREFTSEEWENLHFELISCATNDRPSAHIIDYGQEPWIEYEDARVNHAQVFGIWPKSSWLKRHRDKTYSARLEFYESEQQSDV